MNACAAAARAPATSFVTATGRPTTTRGAGRPAWAAASRMRGTVCSRIVFGPVIQVIVPSASRPVSASILGARAATRIAHGFPPGTASCAFTRYSLPQWLTLPLRMSGPRTARYSFMWLYGFANESPSIPSMTIWCERPTPSVKRPPAMACAESACCAIACGWRGKVGITAVPSSMRRVARARSAAAMIASIPMMLANQPLAKRSASARLACATSPSTPAGTPAMSPMPIPIFIIAPTYHQTGAMGYPRNDGLPEDARGAPALRRTPRGRRGRDGRRRARAHRRPREHRAGRDGRRRRRQPGDHEPGPRRPTLVAVLKEAGARPFVVPAMGSHGGATAEGQRAILAGYGIAEDAIGAPIRSSMETVHLGTTDDGIPLHFDPPPHEADHVAILNRVKPPTNS